MSDISDDRALVASLRSGEEESFTALVDGWSGWMLRLARQTPAPAAKVPLPPVPTAPEPEEEIVIEEDEEEILPDV